MQLPQDKELIREDADNPRRPMEDHIYRDCAKVKMQVVLLCLNPNCISILCLKIPNCIIVILKNANPGHSGMPIFILTF